jgi:hypothetical protein
VTCGCEEAQECLKHARGATIKEKWKKKKVSPEKLGSDKSLFELTKRHEPHILHHHHHTHTHTHTWAIATTLGLCQHTTAAVMKLIFSFLFPEDDDKMCQKSFSLGHDICIELEAIELERVSLVLQPTRVDWNPRPSILAKRSGQVRQKREPISWSSFHSGRQ